MRKEQDKLNPSFAPAPPGGVGIYVHVPFCARICEYCKFYKTFPSISDISFYLETLAAEARALFEKYPDFRAQSIFFGGGTPTSLSIQNLPILCKNFEKFAGKTEWTVEAAPSTITPQKLKALKDAGANRLSLGVQSFSEKTLRALGRPHPTNAALKALDAALEVFENVNIDLIFGADGQTLSEWEADLSKAASYPVKHISAYCLEFESGTGVCAGNAKALPRQISETKFLRLAIAFLESRGFRHYEISNYAKAGYECAHNLNTWQMGEWVGLGPSAASQFGGLRRKNPLSLPLWKKNVESGWELSEDKVALDDQEMLLSSIIFGLRMTDGVDIGLQKKRFPKADFSIYESTAKRLQESGLLELKNGKIRLTKKGIPLADSIALSFV